MSDNVKRRMSHIQIDDIRIPAGLILSDGLEIDVTRGRVTLTIAAEDGIEVVYDEGYYRDEPAQQEPWVDVIVATSTTTAAEYLISAGLSPSARHPRIVIHPDATEPQVKLAGRTHVRLHVLPSALPIGNRLSEALAVIPHVERVQVV